MLWSLKAYSVGIGFLSQEQIVWSFKLTTLLRLLAKIWMSGAVPLNHSIPSWSGRGIILLYLCASGIRKLGNPELESCK
jgi:hypothetical protein